MNDKRIPVGLILSAGFSSRMKDFKPLMKIGGRTPLQMLIRKLQHSRHKRYFRSSRSQCRQDTRIYK